MAACHGKGFDTASGLSRIGKVDPASILTPDRERHPVRFPIVAAPSGAE